MESSKPIHPAKRKSLRLLPLSVPFWLAVTGGFLPGTATLELYGNFHTMGVLVTVAAGDDPQGDAVASLSWRKHGETVFKTAFPLVRSGTTTFTGSLFWLEPGLSYDVRVQFADPGGGPLSGLALNGTAATRAELVLPAASRSYVVSPDGSGTQCSPGQPCSLSQALSQAQPGEEILLRGGVYYLGDLTPPRSGTAGAPVVIRSYPGESAILDGADPAAFAWTAIGGGVYQTTVTGPEPHLVLADGRRLFPYASLADLQSLRWGLPGGCHADGTTLYVRLPGDANPGSAVMTISRCNVAFLVERDWLFFLDLTFRHYGGGSWAKAIYVNGGSGNLIRGCTFAHNDAGIGLKREAHRNLVEECEFYDSIDGWSWAAVKETGGLEDGGVAVFDPMTGRGTVIRRNEFHHDFDGLHLCPSGTAGVTNETDVYDNIIHHMGDDGMESDGQAANVRIWNNVIHDVLIGISLAPVYPGPVFALRNLVYRTGTGDSGYPGSPFKFNSSDGPSGSIFLFHNTADAVLPGSSGLHIKAPGSWTQLMARNNIWAGTANALENDHASQPADLDRDDLWNGGAGELAEWGGIHHASLAALQSATGQEIHGWSMVPGFLAPAGGDYRLRVSSGLIEQGLPLPGINDDYQGESPDPGAFEYPGLPGDLNEDGQRNGLDTALLAAYLAGNVTGLPGGAVSADLDGDGQVTAVDLVRLCRWI